MVTEEKFLNGIAEIILSVFDKPGIGLTKEEFCRDGHFSPKMLTARRLLSMRSETLMRFLLYLATLLSDREFRSLCARIYQYISDVGNIDVASAYDIIDRHAGFPLTHNLLTHKRL